MPYAAHVKEVQPDLLVGAVGLICTPTQAETVLAEDKVDLIFMGRELLRNSEFVFKAARGARCSD